MKKQMLIVPAFAAALLVSLLAPGCRPAMSETGDSLAGAWRARVQFTTGALAPVKDLEFMYVFNEGGTMTESSNYDASPPMPPAYGVWKEVGIGQYEARYSFFMTSTASILDEISKGGGWAPNGHGVLVEKITLSEDGNSFDSTITLELFDRDGKPIEGGGEAAGKGERINF